MLLVDVERWGQTIDDLRDAAYRADHARTVPGAVRDRTGTNATQVALLTGRCDESVMAWVHAYNERGPGALFFQRTGGRPLLRRSCVVPPACRARSAAGRVLDVSLAVA
jgi:hypothetical protein